MSVLHNRVSQKELKALLYQETEPRITLSFYRYFTIADTRKFRDELYQSLFMLRVFGRIYIATEGINAQISVPAGNYESLQTLLQSIEPLARVRLNRAVDDDGKSFWVLKIKIRDKIVADGINDQTFNMHSTGKYVNADEFNKLTDDPDTIVVDMRNHYEYEVGHFQNAVEVPSDTFREQLPMSAEMLHEKKDRNIIMYCTGGIRCEKASAYLLHKGFKNVFHLEGGIVHYSREVIEKGLNNKFLGKNFVFDDRLGEKIGDEVISCCHQCGKLADTHHNCNNNGCHLLFIQCAECAVKYKGCCSVECMEIFAMPEGEQKEWRKGKMNDRKVFNKSRHRLRPAIDVRTGTDKEGRKEEGPNL